MRQVFLTLAIAALAALFAAGTAVAEETKITITKKDCRRRWGAGSAEAARCVRIQHRRRYP